MCKEGNFRIWHQFRVPHLLRDLIRTPFIKLFVTRHRNSFSLGDFLIYMSILFFFFFNSFLFTTPSNWISLPVIFYLHPCIKKNRPGEFANSPIACCQRIAPGNSPIACCRNSCSLWRHANWVPYSVRHVYLVSNQILKFMRIRRTDKHIPLLLMYKGVRNSNLIHGCHGDARISFY
jgi:hypothetical protein